MLKDKVPAFLSEIQEIDELFEIEQEGLDEIEAALGEQLNELRVSTASEEGIYQWERFLNLNQQDETLENRRAGVLNALSSQSEAMTLDRLAEIVKQMSGVEATAIEGDDCLHIVITLESRSSNYNKLPYYLEDIVPAHMAFEIKLA